MLDRETPRMSPNRLATKPYHVSLLETAQI